MIFSEINAIASLIEKVFKIFKKSKNKNILNNDTISLRFINLFESHGIHRNQIPRAFGHGITISSVQSDKDLLIELTEQALVDACILFNINREWLDGTDNQIYPTYDFYKNPKEFQIFVDTLLSKSQYKIDGVLLVPCEKKSGQESLLLLQEIVGYIEENPYYRYYLINNWFYSYWKSRAYLTSCIATCCAKKILVKGLYLPSSTIKIISSGNTLMPMGKCGIYHFCGKKWHPEDMILLPDEFLKGINPEINKFGLKAGLKLWLELESNGHMTSGLEDKNTKIKFKTKLEKMTGRGT
jgi:hypothetical protein